MSELPPGWAKATIEDVTQYVQRGKSPKYVAYSDLPVVNQKCVRWWGVDEAHLKYVDPAQWATWGDERSLQDGDILWNSTGTGTIGRAAIFRPLRGAKRVVADSHVTIVRANNSVLPSYLHRLIQSPAVQSKLDDMQSGSTNQVELSKTEVLATGVPLPPLPEQRRIVAKIDSLTGKSKRARDHLDHIPRLVEKYKQAVLAAAFRGDLTRELRDEIHPRYEDAGIDGRLTDLDSLPEGWIWTSIGAVGQISGGLTKNASRSSLPLRVPYLRVGNVYADELRLDEITEIGCTEAEYRRTLLQPGDLLIVEGNGSLDQIGRVALWNGERPGCAHQNHLIRARMGSDVVPAFSLFWLLSPQGRKAIETVASSSSGLHTLSISKVSGLPIPVCSKPQQQQIVSRIRSAFTWIDRLASDATSARKLIDHLDQSVLAKAFRGELVPQDPSDEPASVLLERIKAERGAAPKTKRGRKGKPT